MSEPVLYDEEDGVGLITVNRPQVDNALNLETIAALRALLLRLQAEDRLRALILTGAGEKSFLSGGDIKEFQTLTTIEQARAMAMTMKEVTALLAGLAWPVIAAVNGLAIGGGCETAVACDFRIAAEHARLGYRQIALGLISGWGGGPRLIRLIGRNPALRLMLTGELLDAEAALAIGLVDQVVPSGGALPAARGFARTIADRSPSAVRAYKRLAQVTVDASLEVALAYETELFGPIWVSEEHDRLLQAFFATRARGRPG